jgi:hypothetical protein
MKETAFSHRFVTIYLNNLGILFCPKEKRRLEKSFIDGAG